MQLLLVLASNYLVMVNALLNRRVICYDISEQKQKNFIRLQSSKSKILYEKAKAYLGTNNKTILHIIHAICNTTIIDKRPESKLIIIRKFYSKIDNLL